MNQIIIHIWWKIDKPDKQSMPNTALFLEIVFENDNTFINISKEECKLLLDTSCSICIKNQNILNFM